jgi:ornithine carbamoyltransferase
MKHFIAIPELTSEQVQHILDVALQLKDEWKKGGNRPILAGKSLALVFQKPSLRTRVSFEMAMHHLGGYAFYLSPDEIGLGKRESVADVARVLSRYVDCIMARVFAHQHIEELAAYSRVPVINGLSDYNHPCQAMADLLTVLEHKGDLKGRMLTFVGDGNNVATSLAFATAQLGMNFTIATPVGYELPSGVVSTARKLAERTGGQIKTTHDPMEAVRGADVIYADVWTSMGQEKEKEERLRVFPPYQVNAALVALAKPDVIVEHCLPAHRGEEITDEVADGPHSVLFDQAENRMHAQKAILAILLGGL